MSRLGTILLLVLAVAAAAFLWLVEPRWKSTREEETTRGTVLNLDPGAIRGIRVTTGNDGFDLTLKENSWWIGPKPKDVASPQEVAKLLNAAANLQASDHIRAENLHGAHALDDYGLENPRSQIDFTGSGKTTLYFGKDAAADGRIYVRRADSRDVYVVSDELQRLAFRNAQDFRDRRLTNLAPDDIEKFTIKRAGGEIALEHGAHGWEIVRPFHARADDDAVEKLLKGVLGLGIIDFVADESDDLSAYGLGEPRVEWIFQVENEARPVALRVGGEASQSGGKAVLAQLTSRDSVYHLPESAWTLAQTSPDDLRDRHLLELNLDTVDAIRIRDGAKNLTLKRNGDNWQLDGHDTPADAVQRLADALSGARVLSYLPLTAENLRQTGLDQPQAEIHFDAWLSENTPEETSGRHPIATVTLGHQDGDRVYVRVDENPEICVVPAAAVDALRALTSPQP
jgi:hypothetical protein